jgi:hypothetical protein
MTEDCMHDPARAEIALSGRISPPVVAGWNAKAPDLFMVCG